jgi:transcription elongation factor GreA
MATRNAPIQITPSGLAALESELAELKAQRGEVVDRVASARSDGDLKENFAYHDARRDLGMLDGRVQTIEGILRQAVVVAELGDGSVSLGSEVVVVDEFGESVSRLVGPTEADLGRGWISIASPLGAALLGRRPGDEVGFATPGGDRKAAVKLVRPGP